MEGITAFLRLLPFFQTRNKVCVNWWIGTGQWRTNGCRSKWVSILTRVGQMVTDFAKKRFLGLDLTSPCNYWKDNGLITREPVDRMWCLTCELILAWYCISTLNFFAFILIKMNDFLYPASFSTLNIVYLVDIHFCNWRNY